MNTKHINGITVIGLESGEKLGSVSDIVLTANGRNVAALGVDAASGSRASELPPKSWLAAENVHAIGPDALTIQTADALQETPPEDGTLHLADLLKHKVVSDSGVVVGQLAAIEVDEQSLAVTDFEVSPGLLKSNRMVPVDQILNIGQELVIVSDAYVSAQNDSTDDEAQDESSRVVGDVEPLAPSQSSGS